MKQINKIYSFTLLLILVLLTSCSNDNGESYGTSTGNYWPMAIQNTWNFDNAGNPSQLVLTGSTTFGGTTYYEVYDQSVSQFNVQNWVAKKGATYLQKIAPVTIIQDGVTISMEGYEVPIFKDDLAMDKSWTGIISPKITYTSGGNSISPPSKIKYTGTILEKGATVILNGNTYNEVIKMNMALEITIGDQISTTFQEYWFAKDIGPIRQYQNSSDGTSELTLIDYLLY
jgi:hypothetical protein